MDLRWAAGFLCGEGVRGDLIAGVDRETDGGGEADGEAAAPASAETAAAWPERRGRLGEGLPVAGARRGVGEKDAGDEGTSF